MSRLSDRGVDVCLIVEGAYPFVVGGVANWVQDLILGQPDLNFAIVAIKPSAAPMPWRLQPPANVTLLTEVSLTPEAGAAPRRRKRRAVEHVARLLLAVLEPGGHAAFEPLVAALAAARPAWTPGELLAHPVLFEVIRDYAGQTLPAASFHHVFWATRTLLGGLLSAILAPLPKARLYHTISTGFAGLIAARAAIETGRPSIITEHGIYLLERQIEIMMADWIGDQVDSGLTLDREVGDLRVLWRQAFENYAKACYDRCDAIVALYRANSQVQQRMGAPIERLQVIPNGIDVATFGTLADRRDPDRPIVALIGRVVPIKDVKTFLRAAAIAHASVPNAAFHILGPFEEDPDYVAECRALVATLGIEAVVRFEGKVRVDAWLPRIDLVVLTSLSEAQPLVILEAGACGIPIVAPDVGSCRELIEGEGDPEASGGIVTTLVDPEATAAAIVSLLRDPAMRARRGAALRRRVHEQHDQAMVMQRYRTLYAQHGGA